MKQTDLVKRSEYLLHLQQGDGAHNIKRLLQGDLALSGLRVDTSTIYVDKTNHRLGVCNAIPAYALDVTGNIRCSTGFACNGKNPQTAYAAGANLAAYADGTHGLNTAANMEALWNKVDKIDTALTNNGIIT